MEGLRETKTGLLYSMCQSYSTSINSSKKNNINKEDITNVY